MCQYGLFVLSLFSCVSRACTTVFTASKNILLHLPTFLGLGLYALNLAVRVLDERVEFDARLRREDASVNGADNVIERICHIVSERLLELMPDFQCFTLRMQSDIKHVANDGGNE